MRGANVVVSRVRRDVALFHRVHDRLDVAGAHRDVVGHAGSAGGVEVDRSRRRSRCRFDPERRVLELKVRFDVEVFSPNLPTRIASSGCARRAAADYAAEETISSAYHFDRSPCASGRLPLLPCGMVVEPSK